MMDKKTVGSDICLDVLQLETKTSLAGSAMNASRADQIYWSLRRRICTNRIAPGETIREEELAREFEVSRSPIRRVLAKLEHEGLVEVRHGVGTRVTKIDKHALKSIYETRMLLWAQTGPHFVDPLPLDLANRLLEHKAAFLGLEPQDIHGFADTNVAYYMDFTGCVANPCLREIHRNLFFSTSRMWLIQLPLVDWSETVQSIAAEIDDEICAIRNDDPDGLGFVSRNAIFTNMIPMLSLVLAD